MHDLEFNYVVESNPELEPWRKLAAAWYAEQIIGRAAKRAALNKFLTKHLPALGENNRLDLFFLRSTALPPLDECLRGAQLKVQIKNNNHIHDFLEWVMAQTISIEDDHGNNIIPAEFHNPITRRSGSGITYSETVRPPLPFRYIKELRSILCKGEHFSDWTWAHKAMDHRTYGDWFEVDPKLIDKNDPDCVWRKRTANIYNNGYKKGLGGPYRLGTREIYEIWSPVRSMAVYVKLELPLRTFQVRMLDSGEADTWTYQNGSWKLNDGPLAQGSIRNPVERGVFRRITDPETGQIMTGLFINTNKTADIQRPEKEKGYIVPWEHKTLLYWLEKLRNWQARYNPISSPMPWTELHHKHLGESKSEVVLKDKGSSCFLFRDPASLKSKDPADRQKPIYIANPGRMWFQLLSELERRCLKRGETLDDKTQLKFVKPGRNGTTYYPLHALRVSLITAYALEGGVPMPILSKLIAGHARLIMTIYYVKAGVAHTTEVMNQAEKRIMESEQQSFKRFLVNATYDQLQLQSAFNSTDAINASIQPDSFAALVVKDKGICPMGCNSCDCGGELLNDSVVDARQKLYAPVPGYPQEKNCVRCRFFITGPAFLPGLQAHFNAISYRLSECSKQYIDLEEKVKNLEDLQLECEEKDHPFTKLDELSKLHHLYEQEAQKADKLANDLNATLKLIDRCTKLLENRTDNTSSSFKLVPAGEIADIKWALMESQSNLHQLEVICENAEVFLETDASKAVLRRSQILDAMLMMNKKPPVFLKLTEDQQLSVGNELMALIKARTGSLKGAVELVEGGAKLQDLGLLNDAMSLLQSNDIQSLPASDILEVDSSDHMSKNPVPAIPETTGGA